jgi:hypothetical protein
MSGSMSFGIGSILGGGAPGLTEGATGLHYLLMLLAECIDPLLNLLFLQYYSTLATAGTTYGGLAALSGVGFEVGERTSAFMNALPMESVLIKFYKHQQLQ